MLLSYENEAILARQSGADFDYVVPDQTLLIQNPGAVTTDASPKAKKFLDFLTGKRRRPTTPRRASVRSTTASRSTSRVPTTRATRSRRRKKLLTIDKDFGGWAEAEHQVLRREDGIVTQDPEGNGQGVVTGRSLVHRHGSGSGRSRAGVAPGPRRVPLAGRPASASAWRCCGSACWC